MGQLCVERQYRNSCFGEEGIFPSEKVLSYKPKMLLDLINPKKNYKSHLDKSFKQKSKPESLEYTFPDEFDKLKAGDKLLYKNFNKKDVPRWLEAKFVKRISINVFQIALGSHVLTAHRNQLKMLVQTKERVKVMLAERSNARRGSIDDQEDFLGFPDAEETSEGHHVDPPAGVDPVEKSRPVENNAEAVRKSRKRKHIESSPMITRSKLRRVVQN